MSARPERKLQTQPDAVLLASAQKAARQAYAPYSSFRVGCAVRTASGAVHVGCNVENASYPVGICAERAAVAAAMASEGPSPRIERILVCAVSGPMESPMPCTPCGACRQVIAEVAPDATIGFFLERGEFVETAVRDLLPHAFGLRPA